MALTRLQLAELLLEHYPDERAEALDHLDFAIAELRDIRCSPPSNAPSAIAGSSRPNPLSPRRQGGEALHEGPAIVSANKHVCAIMLSMMGSKCSDG